MRPEVPADIAVKFSGVRATMVDTDVVSDLGNLSLEVGCVEDTFPPQYHKLSVLSTLSLLTLASNALILAAILTRGGKVGESRGKYHKSGRFISSRVCSNNSIKGYGRSTSSNSR